MRAPCVRCGLLLHTGEGRVTVSFQAAELAELAAATSDRNVRERLLCALGLIDDAAVSSVRADLLRDD
jgi:hypothetical protein